MFFGFCVLDLGCLFDVPLWFGWLACIDLFRGLELMGLGFPVCVFLVYCVLCFLVLGDMFCLRL